MVRYIVPYVVCILYRSASHRSCCMNGFFGRRPALMKYIEILSEAAVQKASAKALRELAGGGKLKSAIEALAELKGVRGAVSRAPNVWSVGVDGMVVVDWVRLAQRRHPLCSRRTTTKRHSWATRLLRRLRVRLCALLSPWWLSESC